MDDINPDAKNDASPVAPQAYEQLALVLVDLAQLLLPSDPARRSEFQEAALQMSREALPDQWLRRMLLEEISKIP